MRRVARSIYRRVYWGGLLLFLVGIGVVGGIGEALGSQTPGTAMAGVWLFWLVFGRRLAFYLVPIFVSRIRCPGCGEEQEPRAVWNCNCGFHDHRERNLLTLICPACGKVAGHFNCPSCEATILLW